jgi:hypothetical protein
MTRGEPQLDISVVPDSGTGELAGIVGRFAIDIVDGKHFYDFDYTPSRSTARALPRPAPATVSGRPLLPDAAVDVMRARTGRKARAASS